MLLLMDLKRTTMEKQRRAINVLLNETIDDGLATESERLGVTKSRIVRFICLDYLTRNNILESNETTLHHLL